MKNVWRPVGLVLILALMAGAWACDVPEAKLGLKGNPCYGNGTCNPGLDCIQNVCQDTSKEAVGDASSDGVISPDTPPVDNRPVETSTPDVGSPEVGTVDTPDNTSDAGTPEQPTTIDESKPDTGSPDVPKDDKFSFFVTSLEAMQKLSGSKDGFGGDLGGLEGADRICQTIAAGVGYGHKVWRAFISVTKGPDGQPVHAIDRVGKGPWYDRNGRLISKDIAGLTSGDRPAGDPQAVVDLTNEHGQGQHQFGDNHDTITGSNKQGRLNSTTLNSTCQDWTSKIGPGSEKLVMIGHSWPRSLGSPRPTTRGAHWIADHTARGCSAGVNLTQNGGGTGDCIGCGGGYGGLYCFALNGTTYKEAGTKCTKDADCQASQRCFIGYCLAKPAGCRSNADCSAGQTCRQGTTGVACR